MAKKTTNKVKTFGILTISTEGMVTYKPISTKKEIHNKDSYYKVAIHGVRQRFGDNKEPTLFSDQNVEEFTSATGLNLTNRPTAYGIVLNQAQNRVLEGILKAFSATGYRGHEQRDKSTALREIYSDTRGSQIALVEGEGAPYKNIDTIPVVRLTQAQLIERSGYDLKKQRHGDKQDVLEALALLTTKQFCFYWKRLKYINGKPAKNKDGDYVKEMVMEVGTILRMKTIRDEAGQLQYYEIHPSAAYLDQLENYFLLFPENWIEEVWQLTGKRVSSYTLEFLTWLRLQYEEIRRFNKGGGKKRLPRAFKISKSWEEVAIALKMPETMYKRNRDTSQKIIEKAYSTAIDLGYLVKVENNGATDILYLNENYYPQPGELR